MNSINLIGRLGKDPEVKYFEDGKIVAKVSLAVKKWNDGADWFDLEVWGKQAQTLADYTRKGDQIGIAGRMTQEAWTDRNTGEERKRWIVKVSSLDLLAKAGERPSGISAPAPDGGMAAPVRVIQVAAQQSADWTTADVPF